MLRQPLPDRPSDVVQLGKISGVFGVKGWVKIYSYTSPVENILSLLPWVIEHKDQFYQVEVTSGHRQGKGVVAQLSGINDRDTALTLSGSTVWASKDLLPETESNEYYWSDLEGMDVWAGEQKLGIVDYLIETGANDVLVIRGDKERLVPFIQPDVVKSVDIETNRIDVDWDPDF
jgi:16S rRNA processing protein RimM